MAHLVPLMRGGSLPAIITEWKRLAGQEPDGPLRATYAGLSLVFAEAAGNLVEWQKGLEGWNVWESQVIRGWMEEGAARATLATRRQVLLQVLRVRFQAEAPEDVKRAVEGTTDLEILSRWFDAAVTAASLDDFRASA